MGVKVGGAYVQQVVDMKRDRGSDGVWNYQIIRGVHYLLSIEISTSTLQKEICLNQR